MSNMRELFPEKNYVIELCCNIDDMSGEDVAYAAEKLMAEGAADVCWLPVGMKKGRPGMLLIVMCAVSKKKDMLNLIFKHTSTIGVRETVCRKHILRSEIKTIETPYGPVRIKDSIGYGIKRMKEEFEDLKRIAAENNLPVKEVRELINEYTRN